MRIVHRIALAAAVAAVSIHSALAGEFEAGDLRIIDPAIRATAPGAPVAGGFMTIRNTGSQADRLVGGSADFAESLEVHEMHMDGDVMKMRELAGGLEIPAGGEVVLKPGSYHVMFMGLKERMRQGETHNVRLQFEVAGEVELPFEVVHMSGH